MFQVFLDGETKGVVMWPEYNGNFNIESSSRVIYPLLCTALHESCKDPHKHVKPQRSCLHDSANHEIERIMFEI